MKLSSGFLEDLSQAAWAQGLAEVAYGRIETPIGKMLVARTAKGVCRIAFAHEVDDKVLADVASALGPRIVHSDRATAADREAIQAYLDGDLTTLDLPVDLVLMESSFGLKVLTELRRVGRGHVTTYGALADRIGHPRAARATGTALGRNPVPIIVPCHRVIRGSGAIGQYGGATWRKRWLLELEGAIEPTEAPS